MLGDLVKNAALATAERVRKNLGPRAGLLSYRTLAENSADSETRGRAVLEGLSCAIEVGDEDAAGALVGLYAGVTKGNLDVLARSTVQALQKRGFYLPARGLAALEVERFPRARSAYLHARCLESAGDSGALSAFERAEDLARIEGASAVETASRAFRVVLLYEQNQGDDARALEKTLALREIAPALLLRMASHGLLSASRFARAGWLTELDRLAREGAPAVGSASLALVCAHAERMGQNLTEMELDRTLAVFAKLRDERLAEKLRTRLVAWRTLPAVASELGPSQGARHTVLSVLGNAGVDGDALAYVRRALEVIEGRFEPKVAFPYGDAVRLAVAAAAALRDGDSARAMGALDALAAEVEKAAFARRRPAWEVATLGLFADDERVRASAVSVVAALLRGAPSPPPRGALFVARACRVAGAEGLAEKLLAIAVDAREPGANEAYSATARELAWKLAKEGRKAEALRLLREAKRSGG
jgi:tetratricopeptide (TPR) repeat protein